jgi:hypothetical protein
MIFTFNGRMNQHFFMKLVVTITILAFAFAPIVDLSALFRNTLQTDVSAEREEGTVVPKVESQVNKLYNSFIKYSAETNLRHLDTTRH